MSTNGAMGFITNGVEKVTYNHMDSYPSGLGVETIEFIRNTTDKELSEMAQRINLVTHDSKPTVKQIETCSRFYNGVAESIEKWSSLLRNAQGDWTAYQNKKEEPGLIYMIDNVRFLWDSLFCEWAYIINLDTGRLEIYKGFNNRRNAKGRYADIPESWKKPFTYPNGNPGSWNGYYGVRLVKSYSLKYLRTKGGLKVIDAMNKETLI